MTDLQPIETAPKDGRYILCWRPPGDFSAARWRSSVINKGGEWGGEGWSYPDYLPPTHWTPLPESPRS